MNILALCTGNSARSILLECLLRDLSKGRVTAFSAGSHPAGFVHPSALAVLQSRGHSVAGLRSKSWDEFDNAPDGRQPPVMDAVITVCNAAAAETCPYWPGAPVRAHWGVPDPAAATGRTNEIAAFERAYEMLLQRTKRLFLTDIHMLTQIELRSTLDRATG